MAKAKTAQPVFNLAGSPAGLSAVWPQISEAEPKIIENRQNQPISPKFS
jgi:hypothetical protein